MIRLAFLSALFVATTAAAQPLPTQAIAPSATAVRDLDRVEAHLKGVRTMVADFVQTAGNGAVATGRMTLARPGKVRFSYNGKSPLLVVARNGSLYVIDYKVAQVQRWPIKDTALAVLLDPDKSLRSRARILASGPGALAGQVVIQAEDPKHPEYGRITVTFQQESQAPGGLMLTGWQVVDVQGSTTRVALTNVRTNVAVAANAFEFKDPRPVRSAGKPG
jgi:outer membrane lipoprotein-sorting protein